MKNRVPELRAEHGWTQAELAQRLGVSRQSINAIETGKFDPSLPLAFRLARLFDMSTEELFLDDRSQPGSPRSTQALKPTERSMNDPARRLGIAELVAGVDATHPDLDDVPAELAQRLDTLQPNWRRIIELFREDGAVSDRDRDRETHHRDLETRLAAVESHLADIAYSVGVPKPKTPKRKA